MKKFLLLTLLVISSLLYAEDWTGTGWALKKGYIVTNFHCVDGAKSIVVETSESHYSAKVVATDPSSDLAIIKIDDNKFRGFGEIPYSIERKQCEVGETVWTLGFPMTSIMGDEVKFTDGKISAKTGYMGDLSTYQITVPIHPGNSGGPLFNKNGNVVGVTSSGLDKQLADNVNYAIKANYLLNLIESALSIEIIPNGSAKNLALTEYIRKNKKFVFLLHFSSELSANTIIGVDAEAQTGITQQEIPQPNNTSIELFEYVQIAEDKLEIKKYVGEWREVNIPSVVVQNGKKYSVTQIGEKAFANCAFLTSVNIPNSISEIKFATFQNCSSLISVTLPNTIKEIGQRAFDGCCSLTSITIPDSTYLGQYAFRGCSSLTSVTLPNKRLSSLSCVFENCSSLTSIIIPNGVKHVGWGAFNGCSRLKSVVIPNSVISIEDSAFSGCKSLTSIIIPDSVISIGKWAFSGCPLTFIVIPNSVTSIGEGAFKGCLSLHSITLSNNLTSIEKEVLKNCQSVTSIKIPNNVSIIEKKAFEGCSSLQSITLPDNITTIREEAFKNCKSLTSVTIPINLALIEEKAFEGCSSLTSIIWNAKKGSETIIKTKNNNRNSYETKRASPFHDISSQITTITFGDSVEYIPPYICSCMINLTSITLPSNVQNIGEYAFYTCKSLTSIKICEGILHIGYRAFYGCCSLTDITIPKSVTKIEEEALAYLDKYARITFLGRIDPYRLFNNFHSDRIFTLCTPMEYQKHYKSYNKKYMGIYSGKILYKKI